MSYQYYTLAAQITKSPVRSGNDGWWSTFEIQVGTPGQIVRLLPGTSTSAGTSLWVVLEQGCAVANPNLTDCAIERGYNSGTGNAGLEEFQSNQSSTWSVQGLANGGLYDLNTLEERSLGYSGNAYYGFDTVSWGGQGSALPTLDHQIIAGFATNDFWLGSLGKAILPPIDISMLFVMRVPSLDHQSMHDSGASAVHNTKVCAESKLVFPDRGVVRVR